MASFTPGSAGPRLAHGGRRRQQRSLPGTATKSRSTSTIRRCRSAARRKASPSARPDRPIGLIGAIQAQVRALDPTAVIDNVVTMDAVVGRAVAPWRLSMWMFLLFASVAFGLALTGLVSVVALDVAHRRQEFAIRLALGASAARHSVGGDWTHGVARRTRCRSWGLRRRVRHARAAKFVVRRRAVGSHARLSSVVGLVSRGGTAVAAYIPGRRAARTEVNTLLRHF